MELKVNVDIQGCLPKNHSHARLLCYNHRKLYIARTTKQSAQCQSVGDRLQKCVRLFRYSDWLPRKSILKLAN